MSRSYNTTKSHIKQLNKSNVRVALNAMELMEEAGYEYIPVRVRKEAAIKSF
jgi:hypothetical protein